MKTADSAAAGARQRWRLVRESYDTIAAEYARRIYPELRTSRLTAIALTALLNEPAQSVLYAIWDVGRGMRCHLEVWRS
jgi:hypothetical protein